MKKSRMGRAIRATAQNRRAARIMGIDTVKVYAFTFSLNAGICGVAGVLISIIWVIQPFILYPFLIYFNNIFYNLGLGLLARE